MLWQTQKSVNVADRALMPYHLVTFPRPVGIAVALNGMDDIPGNALHQESMAGGLGFEQNANISRQRRARYPEARAAVPHIVHPSRPRERVGYVFSLAGMGNAPVHEGHTPGLWAGITGAFQVIAHPGSPVGANGILLDADLCRGKG